MQRRTLIRLATLPAALGLAGVTRAQFRVEISGVGATQLPIAVTRFRDEDKSPQPIASIVRADLERSGYFRPIEGEGANLDESSRPAMAEWRSRNVDALAAGSVQRLADGRFDVRFKLWDVVKGSDLGGQASAVDAADLRLAAHRIADHIYEKLTGDKGVFSTRIAYVTRGGGRYTLRVADADGEGGQVALNSPEPIISPAWSPDGQTLAATLSREAGSQLYLMDRSGGNVRRLTTSQAIDTEPVFSADGKTIYFVSDRGGGPQVYRIGAGGGSVERVTFSGSYNISPAISPDGRSLAYVTRQGNAFKLMTLELAPGSQPVALTDTSDDESPSFAPNGKLIIYATRAGGRDVLMTTTLDGKIKARLVSTTADVREPTWGPYGR